MTSDTLNAPSQRLALEMELRSEMLAYFEPMPNESASEWCVKELPDGSSPLWIPTGQASNPGPFTFNGREYARTIVDFFSEPGTTDLAACFGSQLGKTVGLCAGLASKMVRDVCAAMWAMPNEKLAKRFSRGRWIPFLRASAAVKDFIPDGKDRHMFSILSQRLGSSMLDFIGSNSPANLSSTPVGVAVADEIDKFASENANEAAALNLLEQRTKDFPNPKRAKTSTPTTTDGPIWQEFLKGNQCRYFVPCPHCKKRVVKAWSKQYTIFRLTGSEAFAVWDKEAKLPQGRGWEGSGWDLDRVVKSARYQCPHCGGHILDGHNTLMVREGIWTPTNPFAPSTFRSLHLPSLYGSSQLTRVGELAKAFLMAKHGLSGVKGFINGELAEPDEGQGSIAERVEIISDARKPLADKTIRILAGDIQAVPPNWAVCREFDATGNSRLVEWFTWENWNQFRDKQIELGVDDMDVAPDSGHRAQDVYSECFRFGKRLLVKNDNPKIAAKSEWFGWTPMKGRDEKAIWKDAEGNRHLIGLVEVPEFQGLQLLEFNGHELKNILERLRKGKTTVRWELTDKANEEYFKHLDGEILESYFDSRTRRVRWRWKPRSQRWPIHLKDCELMILAKALQSTVLKLTPEMTVKP